MFSYIIWDVSPQIIEGFIVRWYGLLFAMAFIVGYYIMNYFFKREKISEKILDKLTLYMLIGTVVGARLGHCLFYQPDYYLLNPIEILFIWQGGLASHGAAIGILLSLWLFSKKYKISYLSILDKIVIVVALAGVFIRLGNLMNSEIYGKPTTVPWAFIFIRDNPIPRHPTQIYEALGYLIIFIFLFRWYKKDYLVLPKGKIFSVFLISLFSFRFFIEFFKDVQVDFENYLPLDMGQLLSIPFIFVGIWLLFKTTNKKSINNG